MIGKENSLPAPKEHAESHRLYEIYAQNPPVLNLIREAEGALKALPESGLPLAEKRAQREKALSEFYEKHPGAESVLESESDLLDGKSPLGAITQKIETERKTKRFSVHQELSRRNNENRRLPGQRRR